ncbi:MAG: zinc-ribbon domain-containing protein [Candidatus Woesearchaeota archaeon]
MKLANHACKRCGKKNLTEDRFCEHCLENLIPEYAKEINIGLS